MSANHGENAPDDASFEKLVRSWAEHPDFEGAPAHLETIPARQALFEDLDPPVADALKERLAERGVERLYRHQARAIANVRAGINTVMVSGTASGKSLGYQVPIVEAILDNPRTSAMLLFPTKALAQDQLRSFQDLRIPGLVAATYDGDTAPDDRTWVRRRANVVMTNPDMLHVGILPNHAAWADYFLRLRYVVVDELHVLRGIFGSHVAHILRRLRRIAAHYGSHPTFVFASATIGNPGELAQRLSGLPVEVISRDDSPSGEKTVALWNPPMGDNDRRRSALSESTDLFVDLVRRDKHTIVFTRSRKATELIYRWTADRLDPDRAERIAPYRGGYLASDRRRVEAALFSGDLIGVTATNALELGIDVGGLDAAIITTFPGTIASFWQQAGRAGRSKDRSLAVLVGGEDALDQYFMTHPAELFTRPSEAAVVNPDNPTILDAHTACAAYELPLDLSDRDFLGSDVEEAATRLVEAGDLKLRNGRLFWAHRRRPAPGVSIRSSGGHQYQILDVTSGELLGTLEEVRVFSQAHPGAVYLHQGDSYLVDTLDTELHEVHVTPAEVDWYTQPHEEKLLEVLDVTEYRSIGSIRHSVGRVLVESRVVAYRRKKIGSGDILSTEPLDLPPVRLETDAVWFTIPDEVVDAADVAANELPGSLHAAEHAAIGMLPLFAICDRWDLGGLSTPMHPATANATIFIHEAYQGGAGISPVAFATGERHLRSTLEAIDSCPCETGCPSCIQSPKCGNYNEPLSKQGAVRLLRAMLSGGR
ncbi:MAG: DEAD/DEAH box helicase [Gammaproteobacteria bacterium]|nr:DEAD/DEAH box helicase [Gammaproteobacteria bacterium]